MLSAHARPIWGSRFRGLVALGLVSMLSFALVACGENEILHGLDEREANGILVVLDSKEIDARKEKEEGRVVAWKVVVPSKYAAEARSILVDFELPKRKSVRLAEVFAEGGMIPTASEEKAKMLVGIQGEIEQKLKLIPGVLDVHAQVVIPNKEAVRDVNTARPQATASVVVVYEPIGGKIPYAVEDIQKAVSASVEGMTPAMVTVLSYRNRPMSEIIAQHNQATMGTGNDGVPAECPPAAAPATPIKKLIGVQIVDSKKNAYKLLTLLSVAGGLILLLLILTIIFLMGRVSLKKQLRKALAENLSYKKARGDASNGA